MADKKNEFLNEFKFRSGYVVSETPKYRPLVGDSEEFDSMPTLTNEAGVEPEAEKPEGMEVPEPTNSDVPPMEGGDDPMADTPPEGGVPPEGDAPAAPVPTPDPMADVPPEGDPMGAPVEPQPEVDEIQNEIIKHNIEAMKGIRDQLNGLDMTMQGLNQKMEVLNSDVEEVREPTDSEKLMAKKEVSYPYYLNLNDFWKDNWFDQNRIQDRENNPAKGEEVEAGIRELPDGSYVADFDDLPQKSKIDVKDSFNDV